MGQNVLIEFRSKENTAKKYGISVENVEKELGKAKAILFDARQKRPRPHLDNKIITSWNGKINYILFIKILYIVSFIFILTQRNSQ